MPNARLDEAQAGIHITRRNISNLRYTNDTTLMAESKELKSILMKVKEESEKADLKQHSKYRDTGIWSHTFMANRWGNNRKNDKIYFLGFTNHCRWWLQPWNEIKRCLLAPWKKSYGKPRQHIKKHRLALLISLHLVKAMVFTVVMYRCESGL